MSLHPMSYATLSNARDEGVTTEQANDLRLQALLDAASTLIDEATGWWFDPREGSWTFDGAGAEVLQLPAPIIELTSVSIDGTALDLATVITYGDVAVGGADVRYPRLARTSSTPGLVVSGRRSPCWPVGRQNITVEGTLGFTKADGLTAPDAIREACLRLAIRSLPRLTDTAGQAERERGRVFRETTDGHSYELSGVLPGAAGTWRSGGLTGDPSIDLILASHRRPSTAASVGVRPVARRPWSRP